MESESAGKGRDVGGREGRRLDGVVWDGTGRD